MKLLGPVGRAGINGAIGGTQRLMAWRGSINRKVRRGTLQTQVARSLSAVGKLPRSVRREYDTR
jgi:hypothetical protein